MCGIELADGTHEEFAEDCSRPLRDFPCPEKLAVDSDDAQYAYNFHTSIQSPTSWGSLGKHPKTPPSPPNQST